MHVKLAQTARLGLVSMLFFASTLVASRKPSASVAGEEHAIRTLMSRWVEAYQDLDAKQLAALETPDVETVDRFGERHRLSGRSENEELWADTFEIISRNTSRPTVAFGRVRFLRPDVAVIEVSWRFADGILLVDGDRIPPFSEVDTYVTIKSKGVWLVAVHTMQDKKPQPLRQW